MTLGLLVTGLLVVGRVSGLLLTLPIVSAHGVPRYLVMVASAVIAVLVLPGVPVVVPPGNLPGLALMMVWELALGGLAGMGVSIAFGTISLGAEVMAMQMGFTMASLFDPLVKTQESVLGALATWLAGVVFLGSGLHLVLIERLAEGLRVIPPGHVPGLWSALEAFPGMVGESIVFGVQLAGPILGLIWIINLFVAVLAKLAPRMNVFFSVGMTLNAAVGVGLVSLALPWLLDAHHRAVVDAVLASIQLLGGR